jgi:beta-lactamase regulating signal transducer with metallopeptidase domain
MTPTAPEPTPAGHADTPQPFDLANGEAPPPAADLPLFLDPLPEDNAVAEVPPAPRHPQAEERDKPTPTPTTPLGETVSRWLVAAALTAYLAGGTLLLARWLLGYVVLWRLLRRAEPAPVALVRLFDAMTSGCQRPRLLLSKQARVPFSCGLLRPTIVLPSALGATASPRVLRWIFAHEWTHLRRRDAWAGLLFGVGQLLYFPLPWFWRLRRQVRLCQEYIADAAAAGLGRPEDYAQFLLSWTAAPSPPAGTSGVSGSTSDLFRRITMLLRFPAPVQPPCSRRWSVLTAGGLLILAVLVAGVGLAVQAAPVPIKKDTSKKDETKKEEPKKQEPKKDVPADGEPKKDDGDKVADYVEQMIKNLPPGTDPKMIERMREQMKRNLANMPAEQRKMMQQMMQRVRQQLPPGGLPNMPGMPGFGDRRADARLGARVETPSATLIEQMDLPKDQGLVLREVSSDSAADKAGLKAHDILLELNGKPVPSRVEGLTRLMADIKPDAAVEAVVLRKGKKETIKGLKLPEAKAPAFPGVPGGLPGLPGAPGAGFPGLPGAPGGAGGNGVFVPPPGGGAVGVMTTLFRNQDRFTLRHQEGSLVITLTGKAADGKAKVSTIHVQDGRESNKYESVDKVPEQYRDKVKNLMEMSEKSSARIELKTP